MTHRRNVAPYARGKYAKAVASSDEDSGASGTREGASVKVTFSFLARTGLVVLACFATLVFLVASSQDALAQEPGSTTSEQYEGDPNAEYKLMDPPPECPPSGVLPDGTQCADATVDTAENAAEDSLNAADAVGDTSTPEVAPSSSPDISPSSENETPPVPAEPSDQETSPKTSATETEPTGTATTGTATTGTESTGTATTENESGDEAKNGVETEPRRLVSEDEAKDRVETEPRRLVSEDEKFRLEQVDNKALTTDETRNAGSGVLAMMGGGSALLLGIALLGRLFKDSR